MTALPGTKTLIAEARLIRKYRPELNTAGIPALEKARRP